MKTLPNHIVFREAEFALKNGRSVNLRVVGTSMEPFLVGNQHIVKITPFSSEKLSRGDVVLFKIKDFYCLHRIISIRENSIILCGDGVYQSQERISPGNIIGVLDSVICQSGDIILCSSIKWKINSYIWMALFPFRRYLLYAYRNFYHHK